MTELEMIDNLNQAIMLLNEVVREQLECIKELTARVVALESPNKPAK